MMTQAAKVMIVNKMINEFANLDGYFDDEAMFAIFSTAAEFGVTLAYEDEMLTAYNGDLPSES